MLTCRDNEAGPSSFVVVVVVFMLDNSLLRCVVSAIWNSTAGQRGFPIGVVILERDGREHGSLEPPLG